MRKIKTIKSSSANSISYYTQDEQHKLDSNYYSDSEQHQYLSTEWYGKGAKTLGLEGSVSAEDLERTMKGFSKEGSRLRPKPKDGVERYAHDFTISAPKSVSIALYLGNDIRIFKAHLKAVRKTLDLVESRYAKARLMVDGERQTEATNNIAVAIINHATSRANDPQLHSHCLIQNATLRSDGQWRSLFPEGINNADWLGHFYRAELERHLNEIGYGTYQTRDGFELNGLSKDELDNFSQRTNEIAQYLKANGLDDTPANRQKAALESRKNKTKAQSLEQLQKHWKAEAEICDIHIPQPSQQPITQRQTPPSELIDSAIAHYSERLVSFRREDLYRYAYENGQTPYLEALDRAIETHPELIEYERGNFTTQSALDREVESIKLMESGNDSYKPFGLQPLPESLNAGQREAIKGVLQSSSQVLLWHGKSGVGKTFALGRLKDATNLKIRGLSPTRKAAGELAESLDIETDTVQGHLLKEGGDNELWVVDEAGLLSAEDGLKLLQKAKEHQARVLLVGDIRQNQSIGAGSFMKSLIDHGAETWNISKILRQENDIQQKAVELISNGQGKDALTLLDDHGYIEETPNLEARATAIAKEYVAHPDSLIVAGTNADRAAIALAIRKELDLKDDQSVQRLIPLGLSKEQLRQSHNFSVGDYLRLERNYKTASIERGKLYQIVGKDGKVLLLESTNGRRYRFDPKLYKEKSLYRTEDIPLDVGDRIRWTRNEKTLGLNNGDVGTIAAIDKKSLSIRTSKGIRTLPINQPLSLDYGYSSTTYQGQGQTAKRVLVSATNDPTSSVEPFYVATSRQRQELKVFAEDKEQLYQWVQNSNQQKNPIELLKAREIEKPVKTPPHWVPDYTDIDLDDPFWREISGSAIDPRLIEGNAQRLGGEMITNRLAETVFNDPDVSQLSKDNLRDKYQPVTQDGIWFYGGYDIRALATAQDGDIIPRTDWGVYKSFTPRLDEEKTEKKGKPQYRKYENPIGQEREFFMPVIPEELADKIYQKHGIDPTEKERQSGVYYVAMKYNLPIVVTEGGKKTYAAVSQGHITIGIQGVNGIYQARDPINKERLPERRLNPLFKVWATPGREIAIAFDADSPDKVNAIISVRREKVRTIEQLQKYGVDVKNVRWNHAQGKGIDDLIVESGPKAFDSALNNKEAPDREIKAHYRTEYNRLLRKFSKRHPNLSQQKLDIVIGLHAARRGEIKDFERVLLQSNRARENPSQALDYVQVQKNAVTKGLQRKKVERELSR